LEKNNTNDPEKKNKKNDEENSEVNPKDRKSCDDSKHFVARGP